MGFFGIGPLFLFDPNAVFWAPLTAHAIELAALAAFATGLGLNLPPSELRDGLASFSGARRRFLPGSGV